MVRALDGPRFVKSESYSEVEDREVGKAKEKLSFTRLWWEGTDLRSVNKVERVIKRSVRPTTQHRNITQRAVHCAYPSD
jgi:hypothetical protein